MKKLLLSLNDIKINIHVHRKILLIITITALIAGWVYLVAIYQFPFNIDSNKVWSICTDTLNKQFVIENKSLSNLRNASNLQNEASIESDINSELGIYFTSDGLRTIKGKLASDVFNDENNIPQVLDIYILNINHNSVLVSGSIASVSALVTLNIKYFNPSYKSIFYQHKDIVYNFNLVKKETKWYINSEEF